ncbi:translesion error-prone DNA polymerase V autoproteolytic subunit [bacterium]|nr:translesion error-prone DNA polymerase V autoproteolytic subunit [bacterium]
MCKSIIKSDGSIKAIFKSDPKTKLIRPLLGPDIPAGFPSPAQDYIEDRLDLNEYLIKHPSATYFVRVDGYSMIEAGIFPDDILIVDRALEAINKKVIIAVLNGELTVKRLIIKNDVYYLKPDNPEFDTIEVTSEDQFSVWGVVTYVIHKL